MNSITAVLVIVSLAGIAVAAGGIVGAVPGLSVTTVQSCANIYANTCFELSMTVSNFTVNAWINGSQKFVPVVGTSLCLGVTTAVVSGFTFHACKTNPGLAPIATFQNQTLTHPSATTFSASFHFVVQNSTLTSYSGAPYSNAKGYYSFVPQIVCGNCGQLQGNGIPLALPAKTLFTVTTCGQASSATCATIQAAFQYTAFGFTANFTDGSTAINGTIQNITWSFGDGSSGYGGTISHVYAKAGTYIVSDTATMLANDGVSTLSDTARLNVTVSTIVTPQGCGQGSAPGCVTNPPPAPPQSPLHFNWQIGLILLGSIALLITALAQFADKKPGITAGIVVTAALVGALAGAIFQGIL